MLLVPNTLLGASVTTLVALFYYYTTVKVSTLRLKHKIEPPACSGQVEFERAYRVQMNTLEQMGILLPLLWVATLYPIAWTWVTPLVGVIWVIARIIYLRAYMAGPEKRLTGWIIGAVCNLALLILAIGGLAIAWRATNLRG
jgi:glutathione S-transferase